ncbi:MAG TPA: hypothetical protein VLK61_18560, partial [Aquabacterium sp.]|nr:hypothetical protein [Aquabacterium sp.]
MDRNARSVLHQRRRSIGRRLRATGAVEYFNVLTGPELLETTEALLEATEKSLQQIKSSVEAGRLVGATKIGVRVGKVVNRYKVSKHFDLDIGEASFTFSRQLEAIN